MKIKPIFEVVRLPNGHPIVKTECKPNIKGNVKTITSNPK